MTFASKTNKFQLLLLFFILSTICISNSFSRKHRRNSKKQGGLVTKKNAISSAEGISDINEDKYLSNDSQDDSQDKILLDKKRNNQNKNLNHDKNGSPFSLTPMLKEERQHEKGRKRGRERVI